MKKHAVTVSRWKTLVSLIYDELDDYYRESIISLYQLVGQDMTNLEEEPSQRLSPQMRFFETVDNSGNGELESARELHRVLKLLDLHTPVAGESLGDKVYEVVAYLEDQRAELEVLTDTKFIGRTSELDMVYQKMEIKELATKCVYISGFGGQGKSHLARKVLFELKRVRPDLVVVRVDLREITSTTEVVKHMVLQSPDCPLPASMDDHKEMENILKQYINNSKTRIIFYLDACDAVLHKDQKVFLKFFKGFLDFMCNCNVWVKILMTGRVKLSTVFQDCHVTEVELQELDPDDAVQMFQEYAERKQIDEEMVNEIVKECAYTPLAICMAAKLVQCGKMDLRKLMFHLKMDTKNVTAQMRVDKFIQESISCLDADHLKVLVGLSVFQSSTFKFDDAKKVIKHMRKCLLNKEVDEKMVGTVLQSLYNLRLLEAETYSKERDKSSQRRRNYSLHQFVSRYLSEWNKPEELEYCYQLAVQQFVVICEGLICKIVQLLESEQQKGQKKLENNRVHILRYYDIMSDSPALLTSHSKKTDDKILYRKKCVSDLADIMISLVKKRRMFQSEADRALQAKNYDVYIFWMVEKADVFLMLHDKPDIAIQILSELEGKFTGLQRQDDHLIYRPLIHALYNKVKAMTFYKLFDLQQAQHNLELASRYFELCPKPIHNMLIARLQTCKGMLLIDEGQLDLAEQILKQALADIKSMVKLPKQKIHGSDIDEERHWDIPRFYLHFAKINLKKAKNAKDETNRNQNLEKALENINHGIKLDQLLKMDRFDCYYAKIKLRADIYIEKGLLDAALVDANFASDHRRGILQPPHTNYTESVYQVGRVYMLQGNDWKDKGDMDKANKHWICAGDYYDEVTDCHLKEGGMALLNPVLQDIKKDHIYVMKHVGTPQQLSRVVRFYKDLETGAYEPEKQSSSRNMLQMLHTPLEFIKKLFAGGGAAFGEDGGTLERIESISEEQHNRMMEGDTSGGRRKDSGMGQSSFEDSMSEGSGSMSDHIANLSLQKSLSIEDNVFTGSGEHIPPPTPTTATATATATSSTSSTSSERRKQLKKRQKTIDE